MDAKDNYVFGLVGCGNIGKRHAEIISALGTLASVCDILPQKAQSLANQFSCNHYQDYDEMLKTEKSLQILVICTPNNLHAVQSNSALRAGLHVLCEKPMALTKNDCSWMLNTAIEEKKLLHIVKQNRFNPPIAYLKNLLDHRKLGRIYSISMQVFWNRNEAYYENTWRGKIRTDGGILFTQFSHFLDILIWLFGEINEVEVRSANFKHKDITEFDDTIVGLFTFKSGILGTVHFSTCSYQSNREGSLSLIGEKGDIKIGGQYLNHLEYHNIENVNMPVFSEMSRQNDYGGYKGSMSNHEKVYKNFLTALVKKDMLTESIIESSLTVDLIEKMHLSISKNIN